MQNGAILRKIQNAKIQNAKEKSRAHIKEQGHTHLRTRKPYRADL